MRLSFLCLTPWLRRWLERYLSLGMGLSVSVSLCLGSSLLLGFRLSLSWFEPWLLAAKALWWPRARLVAF